MTNRKADVLLAGINGFGEYYLNQLLQASEDDHYRLAGVVDIQPERSPHYAELRKRNIPVHTSLESFFANFAADLTIVSTPIPFHCEQTILALENGSHVLCEKPITATVQDALRMREARNRTGKFVAIGFNLPYDEQIRKLKQDILSGTFGRPIRMKTIVLWSRNEAYYRRTGWAGRKKNAKGDWVLDSVAHNAAAHYLFNMLYLLGETREGSADLHWVEAELARANAIENFDTCAARILTQNQVEVLFYASHAVLHSVGPRFCLQFEEAVITYGDEPGIPTIKAAFHDGRQILYAGVGNRDLKLQECVDHVFSGDSNVACSIEAAMTEVICINGMQQSVPDISDFPEGSVKRDEASGTVWVDGLFEEMLQCYEQGVLPSMKGASWARKGKRIDLRDYQFFSMA